VIAVENPATGETVAQVPEMSADDVAHLARRARAAFPYSRRTTKLLERLVVLLYGRKPRRKGGR
jgi:acyl-CoA reductase-like NAD-dependent aldehyde dehydrogenase